VPRFWCDHRDFLKEVHAYQGHFLRRYSGILLQRCAAKSSDEPGGNRRAGFPEGLHAGRDTRE